MLAGIGLMAGADATVPAGWPAADPLGACALVAGGVGTVDPDEGGAEDAGGASLRHDGNATAAASTSKYSGLIGANGSAPNCLSLTISHQNAQRSWSDSS
jgi:hypothetical protein